MLKCVEQITTYIGDGKTM